MCQLSVAVKQRTPTSWFKTTTISSSPFLWDRHSGRAQVGGSDSGFLIWSQSDGGWSLNSRGWPDNPFSLSCPRASFLTTRGFRAVGQLTRSVKVSRVNVIVRENLHRLGQPSLSITSTISYCLKTKTKTRTKQTRSLPTIKEGNAGSTSKWEQCLSHFVRACGWETLNYLWKMQSAAPTIS